MSNDIVIEDATSTEPLESQIDPNTESQIVPIVVGALLGVGLAVAYGATIRGMERLVARRQAKKIVEEIDKKIQETPTEE